MLQVELLYMWQLTRTVIQDNCQNKELYAVIHIKRLPPQFTQKGLIEYPRTLGKRTYIDLFIKMDEEKEITLAHEMMHVKQVLTDGVIDENEAYLYEKTAI